MGSRQVVPRRVFAAVVVTSSVVLGWACRDIFLFWDDLFFLGQARDADLTRAYLADPLFKHFSPVSRLADWALVGLIPDHGWVVWLVPAVLVVATVAAVTWLMVVLHGRTVPALVGAVVLAPSLTLVPLGNWWTAAVNILPALAGCYVCFAALVQLLRGRSRWYAVPCLASLGLAVLAWELPLLMIGYLGLWFLLFGSRVTPDPWLAALRRTWWVWAGVATICVAAALNYRLNYYDSSVGRPAPLDVLQALALSLVRTLVPTAVGFHDPRSAAFSTASLVLGCVVLVAVVGWLLRTRERAWRGLVFAGVGWLLPVLALVLNRITVYGVAVVDNAIYYHLPTVLVVIGLLEAWRGERRGRPLHLQPVVRRTLVGASAVVVLAGYAWSLGPTARYQWPEGADPSFYDRARASADARTAEGTPFTVIDSDAPWGLAPPGFKPYHRLDRVLGVVGPDDLTFDVPAPPYYRFDDTGVLRPVEVDWLAESTTDDLRLLGAEPSSTSGGLCFTATADAAVQWALPTELTGPDLVVRTLATVDGESTVRVNVRGSTTDGFDRANDDGHHLRPDEDGVLDTVAPATVAVVRVKDLTPGTEVCLTSVTVGRVVPG